MQSFTRAQQLARKTPDNQSIEVIFTDGIYYLPETMKFTVADNKTSNATITYPAEHEGKAIISGGSLLKLDWQLWERGIYKAHVPNQVEIDQLYVN